MRRFRVLLSLLLGLSLMTQGMSVAVAAASGPMKAAASSMMSMEMSADMEGMPCMDMDMSDHGAPTKCPSKCCDGKGCADMSRCAQAQPAIATYRLPTIYSSLEHSVPMTQTLLVVAGPPSSPLRPPITLHI